MHGLLAFLHALVTAPIKLFIRTKVVPGNAQTELAIDPDKPVIYLLKTRSVSDNISLHKAALKAGLPSPSGQQQLGQITIDNCMYLESPEGIIFRRKATNAAEIFRQIIEQHHADGSLDLQIIPVTVFWGRPPGKVSVSWRSLIASKASPSWLRKIFIVLLAGRDNLVYFSHPVSARYMANERGSDDYIAHKLIRLARTHFQRRHQTVAGPRQMEREQILTSVVASTAVQQAITETCQSKKKISVEKARQQARDFANEIAADYREPLIRFAEKLLTRLWNKVYNGIEVHHADKIRQLAENGHEIIYVPSHRSHMDYLLLTYAIYHEGLMVPHIAAGINLNFWPAGPFFRRAGAFFMRRSFAGNKLYTAVFREYLEQLFRRGYSVKFYPEGGRSRTGRLLPPKTGMLAMTVQSMFKAPKRPISIVPVYIGYEHVMEVNSYLKELRGKNKKKESAWQVFKAFRQLKNYGTGYLNFGEPINLAQYMESVQPDWQHDVDNQANKKPSWLTPMVNQLATQVMGRINQAAAVNGLNLCALCLLASEQRALSESELLTVMADYLTLLRQAPYHTAVTLPNDTPSALLEQTLKLNKIQVEQDDFGKILTLDNTSAVTLTYYRNNILHLMVVPGLIATMLKAQGKIERQRVHDDIADLLPILKRELSMNLSGEQLHNYIEQILSSMVETQLIESDETLLWVPTSSQTNHLSLHLLANVVQEIVQRYTIVLNLVSCQGPLSRSELEKQSISLAERLCTLHGITAPEFYDKNVIASLINGMRDIKWLASNNDGLLSISSQGEGILHELQQWLKPDVAQSVKVC